MLNKNLLFAVFVAAYSAQLSASVEALTTKDKFNEKVLSAPGLVVVKASATWCGPCKQLAPKFKEIAEEYKDIAFYEVDDKNNELVRAYGVTGYPTVLFFKDGKKVDSSIGNVPDAIRAKINQHKSSTKGAMVMPMEEEMMEEEVVVQPAPVKRTVEKSTRGSRRSSRSSCRSCR